MAKHNKRRENIDEILDDENIIDNAGDGENVEVENETPSASKTDAGEEVETETPKEEQKPEEEEPESEKPKTEDTSTEKPKEEKSEDFSDKSETEKSKKTTFMKSISDLMSEISNSMDEKDLKNLLLTLKCGEREDIEKMNKDELIEKINEFYYSLIENNSATHKTPKTDKEEEKKKKEQKENISNTLKEALDSFGVDPENNIGDDFISDIVDKILKKAEPTPITAIETFLSDLDKGIDLFIDTFKACKPNIRKSIFGLD